MQFKRRYAIFLILFLLPACAPTEDPPSAPPTGSSTGRTEPSELSTPVQQEAPAEVTSRLAVGQIAPAFVLKDQKGQEVSLDNLRTNGNVALVFYRSADW